MQASIAESIKKNGFQKPVKKINESNDLDFFKETIAYERITDLVSRLSSLVSTREVPESSSNEAITKVVGILKELMTWVSEIHLRLDLDDSAMSHFVRGKKGWKNVLLACSKTNWAILSIRTHLLNLFPIFLGRSVQSREWISVLDMN